MVLVRWELTFSSSCWTACIWEWNRSGSFIRILLSTFFALKCRQKATTVKTRDQTNFAIIITWRKTYLIGCYLVGSNLIRLIYTIYVICRLAIIRQILEKLKKSFNSCNIFFSFIISLWHATNSIWQCILSMYICIVDNLSV